MDPIGLLVLITLALLGFFMAGRLLPNRKHRDHIAALHSLLGQATAATKETELELHYHRLAVRSLVTAHASLVSAALGTPSPVTKHVELDEKEQAAVNRIIRDVELS